MKKLVLLFACSIFLFSCTSTIDKKVNTKTMKEDVAELREKYKDKYTNDDFDAAGDAVASYVMGKVLLEGKKVDGVTNMELDKTYKEFLEEAKTKRLKYESEMKVYNNAVDELNKAITVEVIDKGLKDEDAYGFKKNLGIQFRIKNNSSKDLKGFESTLQVYDMFDKRINGFAVSYTELLKANTTDSIVLWWDASFDRDVEKVGLEEMDKLRFVITPKTLVYSDGSKLETPEEPKK